MTCAQPALVYPSSTSSTHSRCFQFCQISQLLRTFPMGFSSQPRFSCPSFHRSYSSVFHLSFLLSHPLSLISSLIPLFFFSPLVILLPSSLLLSFFSNLPSFPFLIFFLSPFYPSLSCCLSTFSPLLCCPTCCSSTFHRTPAATNNPPPPCSFSSFPPKGAEPAPPHVRDDVVFERHVWMSLSQHLPPLGEAR